MHSFEIEAIFVKHLFKIRLVFRPHFTMFWPYQFDLSNRTTFVLSPDRGLDAAILCKNVWQRWASNSILVIPIPHVIIPNNTNWPFAISHKLAGTTDTTDLPFLKYSLYYRVTHKGCNFSDDIKPQTWRIYQLFWYSPLYTLV